MSKVKIGAGILVAGLLIGGIFSTERIPTGYVGVVYNMNGGIEQKTLPQGWQLVAPWKKVSTYSVATEQAYLSSDKREGSPENESFDIPTSDGKLVNVDLEFSYHFDAEKLPTTYTTFRGQSGKQIEQTFIRGKIKAFASEVSSRFSVLEVYGEKRAELNKAVCQHVQEKFAPYGIVIDSVNFPRIGLDEQTAKAVQDRVNAIQELEKAKIEKEKAQILADKQRVEAEGNAQATLIDAKAKSEANEILNKSLTEDLVKYEYIKKWDGKEPTTKVNGGADILINGK